jgi:hypothetical protein
VILFFSGGLFLMLILSLGDFTVWMGAVLPTFQRYMMPLS